MCKGPEAARNEDAEAPLLPGGDDYETSSVLSITGHDAAFFKPGGFPASVYLLSSLSLGVGVFSLPATVKLTGFAIGAAVLVVFAVTSSLAQMLVIDVGNQLGLSSYDEVAYHALGRPGWAYLNLTLIITLYTGNCAHIQTITDLLGDLLVWFVNDVDNSGDAEWTLAAYKKPIVYVILLSIALPFCFQSELNSLRYASTASVTTVITITFVFVGYCAHLIATGHYAGADDSGSGPAVGAIAAVETSPEDFFRAAGAACCTFSSASTLFPVIREMKEPEKAKKAVWFSNMICMVVYLSAAMFGAVAFGDSVKDNCLYNVLPKDRDIFRPFIFFLIVFILLLYPVINYPMVASLESLIYGPGMSGKHSRKVLSIGGAVAVMALDTAVPNLVDLFGLCGALGLGSVSYVVPCLSFLAADKRPATSPMKILAVLLLVLGTTVTVASSSFVIKHIITG